MVTAIPGCHQKIKKSRSWRHSPPCTHVTCSGARDFIAKGAALLADAISLFTLCELVCRYSRAPYFIENPVGVLSSHIRKPDYIFNPCDYAGYLVNSLNEQYSKATCLWTGNGFVMPDKKPLPPVLGFWMHTIPPSKNREILRSATPLGFAQAVFQANANIDLQLKQQGIVAFLERGRL